MKSCNRKDDLMSFLYEESDDADHVSFESHLNECDSCKTEIVSFNRVRDDLSSWQIGYPMQGSFVQRKSVIESVFELLISFPTWARGTTLASVSLSLLLTIFYLTGFQVSPEQNIPNNNPDSETRKLIESALANQREAMRSEFQAELNKTRAEINNESVVILEAMKREYEASLKKTRYQFASQLNKNDSERRSIRSFFAMDDSLEQSGEK